MTLQDLLKECGFKVNDIKSRIINGTIEVDGVSVTDLKLELGDISEVITEGFFFSKLVEFGLTDKAKSQLSFFGLCGLMGGEFNFENDLIKFLSDWKMISTSDYKAIFVKVGNPSIDGVLFHMEGHNSVFRKVIIKKMVTVSIDKIQSDLDKVNKQLGNPGFVDKAPKFKVDEAKVRKNVLERKLKEFNENDLL